MAGRWGKDVILCPYCHGYEVRDQPIAVLESLHHAELLRQWSEDVTLVVREPPGDGDVERLRAIGVEIVLGEVAELTIAEDSLAGLALKDGRQVPCTALFLASEVRPRDALLRELGAGRYDTPVGSFVATTPTGATDVPGVWAAGTVTDPSALVIIAAAQGARAATTINADLIAERSAAALNSAKRNRLESAAADLLLGTRKHGLDTMLRKGK
jgi:thioredoxin reductase